MDGQLISTWSAYWPTILNTLATLLLAFYTSLSLQTYQESYACCQSAKSALQDFIALAAGQLGHRPEARRRRRRRPRRVPCPRPSRPALGPAARRRVAAMELGARRTSPRRHLCAAARGPRSLGTRGCWCRALRQTCSPTSAGRPTLTTASSSRSLVFGGGTAPAPRRARRQGNAPPEAGPPPPLRDAPRAAAMPAACEAPRGLSCACRPNLIRHADHARALRARAALRRLRRDHLGLDRRPDHPPPHLRHRHTGAPARPAPPSAAPSHRPPPGLPRPPRPVQAARGRAGRLVRGSSVQRGPMPPPSASVVETRQGALPARRPPRPPPPPPPTPTPPPAAAHPPPRGRWAHWSSGSRKVRCGCCGATPTLTNARGDVRGRAALVHSGACLASRLVHAVTQAEAGTARRRGAPRSARCAAMPGAQAHGALPPAAHLPHRRHRRAPRRPLR